MPFIALSFILLSIILGVPLAFIIDERLKFLELLVYALILGLSLVTLFVFLFSLFFNLSFLSIFLAILSFSVLDFTLLLSGVSKTRLLKIGLFQDKYLFFLSLFSFLVFTKVFLSALIVKPEGIWAGNRFVWTDWPVHLSLITAFAFGENFPPQNPQFSNRPLIYPFFSDFFSSILVKLGASLEFATEIPGIILATSFIVIFYIFVKFLTKESKIALLSSLLVFFSGGLGSFYFFEDLLKGDSFEVYTYFGEKDIWFFNFIYGEILPQRSFLFGLPLFFLILLLIFKARESFDNKKAFLAGILTGLLPFFHIYSLFSLAVFCLSFAIFDLISFGKKRFILRSMPHRLRGGTTQNRIPKDSRPLVAARGLKPRTRNLKKISIFTFWLKISLLAFFLLACQSPLFISVIKTHHFRWRLGWMEGKENILVFWLKNTGLFIPVLLVSFLKNSRKINFKKRIWFFLAAQMLFIIPNLISLTPWDYDNLKVLTFWFMLSSPLVASLLIKLSSQNLIYKKLLATVLIFTLILTGLIDITNLVFIRKEEYLLWSSSDLKVADFVKKNTPPEAIFLTAPVHHNPINCLAGRKILLGFPGTAWTWGLDYKPREKAVKEMFQGGEKGKRLLKEYGVDYIFLGFLEEKTPWLMNEEFLKKNFKTIYNQGDERIYQIGS